MHTKGESSMQPRHEQSSGDTIPKVDLVGVQDLDPTNDTLVPDHPALEADNNSTHEFQAPSSSYIQDIQTRLRRLEEEEHVIEQTITFFQRQFGDALYLYPRDVRDYLETRALGKQRPSKH